jgi:hypothetical protein
VPQPLMLLHRVDPKQQIVDAVGPWVKDIRIRPYDVMVATYLREKVVGDKVTTTGVFLSDGDQGTIREDRFQGKVGLVMQVGSLAFTETSDHRWKDFIPAAGDWVVLNVGDTFAFDLPGGWRVRIVEENLVRAIVPRPDIIW